MVRFFRIFAGLLFIGICLFYLSVRYVLWPRVPAYKANVEQLVAKQMGQVVTIGEMQTSWDRFMPSMRLLKVQLGADVNPSSSGSAAPIQFAQIDATLSWRTVSSGQLEFAVLRVQSPEVSLIRTGDRQISVGGFVVDLDAPGDDRRGLRWLLAQRRLEIVQAKVNWHDKFKGLQVLEASNVFFVLENRGRTHRLGVRGQIAQASGEPSSVNATALDFKADFTRSIGSQAIQFSKWQGDTYLALGGLDWEMIKPHFGAWLPKNLSDQANLLTNAKGDARLWISVKEQIEATLNTRLTDATMALGKQTLAFPLLALTGRASRDDQDWIVSDLEWQLKERSGLSLGSSQAARLRFSASGSPLGAEIGLQSFNVSDFVSTVKRLPIDALWIASLEARAPKGVVSDLKAKWQATDAQPAIWNLSANVSDASIKPGIALENRLGIPGFVGLKGRVTASDKNGELVLDSKQTTLTFPGLFEEEILPLNALSGIVRWDVVAEKTEGKNKPTAKVKVAIEALNFANPDLKGSIKGSYETGGKGVGLVDLVGDFGSANLLRVHRYIPKKIAAPIRSWFKDAVREGSIDQITFAVKGDLWDFPFRPLPDGKPIGLFRFNSTIQGVTLAYNPEWPELRNMSGSMNFEGPGLNIAMRSGTIYDVKFGRVDAIIEDFLDTQLSIKGRGIGPAQDMVKFVNASPITTRIDNFTSATQISGEASLDLKLLLPLKDLGQTKVDGLITLNNSEVKVDESLPKFDNVSGQIAFTETGFSLKDLTGQFLGGPIKVNASPIGPGQIKILANGQMSDQALRALVNNPLTKKLEGTANYTAVVDVVGRLSSLEIRSDLVGLSSALPAPFAKQAAIAIPLVVKTIPYPVAAGELGSKGDLLNVTVGDDISLAFERRREPKTQRMEIFRGAFGVRADPVIPDAGFAVIANTDLIDLDQWQPILAAMRGTDDSRDVVVNRGGSTPLESPSLKQVAASFAQDFSLLPSLVSVAAADVRSGGRTIKNVVVGASRVEGFWRANISAQDISGYFTWRDALQGQNTPGVLTARFNRLKIPKARAIEVESLLDSSPGQLPGLDIAAEELVVENTNFGKFVLLAQNSSTTGTNVWNVKQLTVENPSAVFSATGQWASDGKRGNQKTTDLKFQLKVLDSGGLLALVGVKDAIKDAPGTLSGSLSWLGSPLLIDYPTLKGEIDVALEKGQFLKIDPGAGKFVSVLNLQSLPKRLVFDFSDMVAQGFLFDRVVGKALVTKGIASTNDLEIRGPQARVKITGTADLALETQDLRVLVTPEINAGLASLAYTAVNPAIGIGTLLAQTILRKPIQDAFAYEVGVKGSWIDPKVEQRRKTPVARREDERAIE